MRLWLPATPSVLPRLAISVWMSSLKRGPSSVVLVTSSPRSRVFRGGVEAAAKGSPIPPPSNEVNQHPIAFCGERVLPFCGGSLHALAAALSVQPAFGVSYGDCRDGIAAHTRRVHALRGVDCDHPSSDRKGLARPRILILRANERARLSWQQLFGPSPRQWSVPSTSRRAGGSAFFRGQANSDTSSRTSGYIPLIGLRGPHDVAGRRCLECGHCSVGVQLALK
jgi:hypothetical protein